MTEHKTDCSLIVHAEQYKKDDAAFDKAVKEYTDKWPDYCQDCQGWGGQHSYYDPSPAGVGLSPGCMMADWEACEECVEKDKCPRCANTIVFIEGTDAESGLTNDHSECPSCGWVEEVIVGLPQIPPEPPECDCWEADEDDYDYEYFPYEDEEEYYYDAEW